MANSAVSQLTFQSLSAATSYATASWTPVANRLEVVKVTNRKATTPDTPTLSGNGITWVQAASYVHDTATQRRITVFVGLSGSGSSAGALTVDFAGVSQQQCFVAIDEWNGDAMPATALAAVIQTKNGPIDSGSVASITITLDSAITSGNSSWGGFHHVTSTGTGTQGAGYTKLSEVRPTGSWVFTEYLAAGSTTVDGSWSASGIVGGIAMEIALVAGAPPPATRITNTTIRQAVQRAATR